MKELKGNPVSNGIARGKIFIYTPFDANVEDIYFSDENRVEEKKTLFEDVREKAGAELDSIIAAFEKKDPEKGEIFNAHKEFLFDEAMEEEIIELIEDDRMEPISAVFNVFTSYARVLSESRDKLLAERSADLIDVRNRFIRNFYGITEKNLSSLPEKVIIVAHDLLPSDTATMDKENVIGIATETGGDTSHSAIIARSYGIPAVLGIPRLLEEDTDGEDAIIDAITGLLILEPDEKTRIKYEAAKETFLKEQKITQEYLGKEPFTKDGERIRIGINIGSADVLELQKEKFADCVGLFRTEFLYMESDHTPTEEELFEAYKKVLMSFKGRHVTIRTLDVGGDKTLSFLPMAREDNPFLGKRALRLCFAEQEIFKTQLRALMRASVYGELWIMLPMVGSIDDIVRAKKIIEDVKSELLAEGQKISESMKLGIMIEIPSIAIMADKVSKFVDFVSIGTNDLCQYLTAVDRLNPDVAPYYQSFHPAMFRLIGNVVKEFNKVGKPVSVCGELGGNRMAAPVLIGLGMRTLSMNYSAIATIKQTISKLTIKEMEMMAEDVLDCITQEEVETCIQSRLQ